MKLIEEKSELAGKHIWEYLQTTGVKARFFAESVGLDEQYLSTIISGKRKPSEPMLAKIQLATGITFFEGTFYDEPKQ